MAKFRVGITNTLGTFLSDAQDTNDVGADLLETFQDMLKEELTYLTLTINGTEKIFKGDYVKNAVMWIEYLEN